MSGKNVRFAVADIVRFQRAVRRQRPHVAHINTAGGFSFVKNSICVMLARVSGSRVLLHPHCGLRVLYSDQHKWLKHYVRFVFGRCAGVIALSQEWTVLSDEIPGCIVHYIPNAVDIEQYKDIATCRLARFERRSPFRVLYLGHLGAEKGSFDLLEAAQQARTEGESWQFELIGDEISSGDRERLVARISELGMSETVTVGESVTGDQKLEAFARADLFVYPSYHEGMPMAIIEALACALPVVATRVGGIPDVIQDGISGILTDPGNPEGLTRSIRSVFADHAKQLGMEASAFRRAKGEFSVETRVDDLVSAYEDAVS